MLRVPCIWLNGIEIDALYSRFGYRTANGGFWGNFTSVRRANVWEFPILGNSQGYMVDVSTGNQQFYTQHGSWEPDAGGGW